MTTSNTTKTTKTVNNTTKGVAMTQVAKLHGPSKIVSAVINKAGELVLTNKKGQFEVVPVGHGFTPEIVGGLVGEMRGKMVLPEAGEAPVEKAAPAKKATKKPVAKKTVKKAKKTVKKAVKTTKKVVETPKEEEKTMETLTVTDEQRAAAIGAMVAQMGCTPEVATKLIDNGIEVGKAIKANDGLATRAVLAPLTELLLENVRIEVPEVLHSYMDAHPDVAIAGNLIQLECNPDIKVDATDLGWARQTILQSNKETKAIMDAATTVANDNPPTKEKEMEQTTPVNATEVAPTTSTEEKGDGRFMKSIKETWAKARHDNLYMVTPEGKANIAGTLIRDAVNPLSAVGKYGALGWTHATKGTKLTTDIAGIIATDIVVNALLGASTFTGPVGLGAAALVAGGTVMFNDDYRAKVKDLSVSAWRGVFGGKEVVDNGTGEVTREAIKGAIPFTYDYISNAVHYAFVRVFGGDHKDANYKGFFKWACDLISDLFGKTTKAISGGWDKTCTYFKAESSNVLIPASTN